MITDKFQRDLVTHMPHLKKYALKLCRDTSRAEDLVQETMLRALSNRDRFELGTNMAAWLTIILRNYFLTEKKKYRRMVEDPDDKLAEAMPVDADQLSRLEAIDLARAIDRLPKQYRAAILLSADGATYEEIAADQKQIALGTVKSRVFRARAMLEAAQ